MFDCVLHVQYAKRKACELEDFQNVTLTGTDLAGDSEVAVKRRKEEKEAGQALIDNFLAEVKALPLSDMSENEAMRKLAEMKQEVMSHNNAFVSDVLARGS